VIEGDFECFVGTEAVGTSGHHSNFVVEALDRSAGTPPLARNQFKISGSCARSMRATFSRSKRRSHFDTRWPDTSSRAWEYVYPAVRDRPW